MEFAITFRGDLGKDRVVAICRQAEAAGFDYAWFFDSHALWRDLYPQMAVAIDHMERDAGAQSERGPRPPEWRLHLLSIMGDVEPALSGPYQDEDERLDAARDYRRAHGPEDGLYRLDVDVNSGNVRVDGFSGSELADGPRRCTLCKCDATGERFGFAVCDYHAEHTEDDPQCPTCAASVDTGLRETREPVPVLTDSRGLHYCHACTEQAGEAWGFHDEHPDASDEWWCDSCECGLTPAAWKREANGRQIKRGDRVRDPHGGAWRTVARVENTTVHMTDGGCMGIDECLRSDVRLPSEALD